MNNCDRLFFVVTSKVNDLMTMNTTFPFQAKLIKTAGFQDGPHQHINPQALANFSDAAQAHLVEAMAFCDGGTGSILQQSSAKSTNPSLKTRVHVQCGENSDWPIECLIGFF